MANNWVVKASYPLGGHVITDMDGNVIRFSSETAAKDDATVRNINRTDMGVYYIAVKES